MSRVGGGSESNTRIQPVAERLKERFGADVDPEISLDERAGADESELAAGPSSQILERLAALGLGRTRYSLKGEIARGGMGAILEVWDGDLRRNLAMKVILSEASKDQQAGPGAVDPLTLGRFLEEAQVTGQLDHPGIVPVHELGLDAEGQVYFTMRLVKGRDLRSIFELVHGRTEGWNLTRALGVLLKVCEAMAYAHAKGVIHRDLKPANVMVGRFGEVYVMDWGLARVVGQKDRHDLRVQPYPKTASVDTDRRRESESASDDAIQTMDGTVVGTPVYMSPEQARGETDELDARADVYALGAMLYHVLTGQMPYVPPGAKLSPRMILFGVLERSPQPLPELAPNVPAELVAITEKAMARERTERYADMSELAEDLRAYLEHRVVSAYRTGAGAELRKWVERNKTLAAGAAAALVVLAGVTALYLASLKAYAADLEESNTALDERGRRVRALALANASSTALDQNSMLALLLAREAVRAERTPEIVAYLHQAVSVAHEKIVLEDDWLFTHDATFSRDGEAVLFAADSEALLTNLDGTAVIRLEGHRKNVTSVGFSPSGQRILTTSQDDTARLWDLQGRQLAPPLQHEANVLTAAFSPDEEFVLTGSADGAVRVWSLDGTQVAEGRHQAAVLHIAFSPDGLRFVTASADETTRIWELDAGAPGIRHIQDLVGQGGQVSRVEFSAQGDRILTSSGVDVWSTGGESAETCLLWDQFGQLLSELETGPMQWAGFFPDGQAILTLANDAVLRIMDTEGNLLQAERNPARVAMTSAGFSPLGDRFAVAGVDGTVCVFDAQGGYPIASLLGHETVVFTARFSSDGSSVVTSSLDGTVRIWDVQVPGFAEFRGHPSAALSVCYSPDGARVATAGEDRTIRLWDANGKARAVLGGHEGFVYSAKFSSDGSRLISASRDYTARLWDGEGNELVVFSHPRSGEVKTAAISPDGSLVATGCRDGTVRVWEADGTKLHEFEFRGWVLGLEFSADGEQLLIGSGKNAQLTTLDGQRIRKFTGHESRITAVAFSPSGEYVLTSSLDTTARLWDRVTGAELRTLRGHQGAVRAASFSADGTRIVTASEDGTARIWTLEGELVSILRGQAGGLKSAVFAPDGRRVLTSSWSGAVRTWLVDPEEILALADRRAHRDFTDDERSRYAELLEAPTPETLED